MNPFQVLLCLCSCVIVASAGVIGFHGSPLDYSAAFGYLNTHTAAYPSAFPVATYATVSQPFGLTYAGLHGYPFVLDPIHYSSHLIPGSVVFTGFPGVVPYVPLSPDNKKDKNNKKKGDKSGDKDSKEEATEKPKEDDKAETEKKEKSEAEDLNQ